MGDVPVHSCRIRVGRSIDGFGLSPGITKEQRVGVEKLMINAVKNFPADLAGQYYPLTGMQENIRQQLVDDHFLFVSGDRNLTVAGMERDWPEGRGIFHNEKKTFLIWVNEEDQLRIISMQMGGDVRGVFERLAKGIKAVQDSVKKESGKIIHDIYQTAHVMFGDMPQGDHKKRAKYRFASKTIMRILPPAKKTEVEGLIA